MFCKKKLFTMHLSSDPSLYLNVIVLDSVNFGSVLGFIMSFKLYSFNTGHCKLNKSVSTCLPICYMPVHYSWNARSSSETFRFLRVLAATVIIIKITNHAQHNNNTLTVWQTADIDRARNNNKKINTVVATVVCP